MEFTVHEAKTHFSKLMKHTLAGEEVVITSGKARTPAVKMVPCQAEPKRKPIRIGWLKGQLGDVGPGSPFFDPLPEEELRAWEGEAE
jgi:antitoxin (DNA-binding transcriptional repressor) of toxin-antitoxin stability system